MATYIDLDYQRLLEFSNGATIEGYTVTTLASATIGAVAKDVGPALTGLAAAGWTLVTAYASLARVIYILTHS